MLKILCIFSVKNNAANQPGRGYDGNVSERNILCEYSPVISVYSNWVIFKIQRTSKDLLTQIIGRQWLIGLLPESFTMRKVPGLALIQRRSQESNHTNEMIFL